MTSASIGDRAVAELVGQLLDAVGAAGEQREAVAVGGERPGGGLADSRGRAGDDRDAAPSRIGAHRLLLPRISQGIAQLGYVGAVSDGGTHGLRPPSGYPPPTGATLPDGSELDLVALAQEVCAEYRAEFPDEPGATGTPAWPGACTTTSTSSAGRPSRSTTRPGFHKEIGWLAGVLGARDFPLDRLERNLGIAAEVVAEQGLGEPGARLAERLRSGVAPFEPECAASAELGHAPAL